MLYVRGDEWDTATTQLPDPLRARLVRFWPGAQWEQGDPLIAGQYPQLTDSLVNPSEWLHEREWRVPHDVTFGWGDVKFLIVPAVDWPMLQAHQYGITYGGEYEAHFRAIPIVAIVANGQLLHDGSGIWTG